MEKLGLTHVFWGNGKGKTTAALGMAVRAAGQGFKVHIIQFMKGELKGCHELKEYGEIKEIEKIENITLERFGVAEWFTGDNLEKHRGAALKGVEAAQDTLSGKYDLVILDEILYAINSKILEAEEVADLIKTKNQNTELVLTGGHKPVPKITELADYVTEMKKEKHPFDKGIKARRGVEF